MLVVVLEQDSDALHYQEESNNLEDAEQSM